MENQEKVMIQEMYSSSKRIELALFGDEKAGIDGLVGKIKIHQKAIEKYENDRNKIIGGSFVISAISAWVYSFFK